MIKLINLDMNDEFVLDINKVSIEYKKFKLKSVSIKVYGGDILGVVGRSGSGKSTLIKGILGLKRIKKGSIHFFKNKTDMDIGVLIGYSPQENSLFPYLTLRENLHIFADMFKVNRKILNGRIKTILKRLRLSGFEDKKIVEFSGGMKKRADIAVALIHNPEIIIFDEPFNGLDVSLQKFIWDFIKDLSKEGKIIMLSSHMLKDIEKNCNRILLIEKGFGYSDKSLQEAMDNSYVTDLVDYLSNLFLREGDNH